MASNIVRGLDDHVKQQLASQAKEHGRSMEAEVRAILTKAEPPLEDALAELASAREAGVDADELRFLEKEVERAAHFETNGLGSRDDITSYF